MATQTRGQDADPEAQERSLWEQFCPDGSVSPIMRAYLLIQQEQQREDLTGLLVGGTGLSAEVVGEALDGCDQLYAESAMVKIMGLRSPPLPYNQVKPLFLQARARTRAPSADEIASRLQIPEKQVEQAFEARAKLVQHYQPLVTFWLNQFTRVLPWVPTDDLTQLIKLGLQQALDRFDPARGFKLNTYARHWIKDAVWSSDDVRRHIPRDQYRHYRQVAAAHDALMQDLQRQPTLQEIAAATGLQRQQVEHALQAVAIGFPQAWPDEPPEGLGGHTAAADEQVIVRVLLQQLLGTCMVGLSERESLIIAQKYWNGLSYEEIAKILNITANNVKQIHFRALHKLRDCLDTKFPGLLSDELEDMDQRPDATPGQGGGDHRGSN